MKITKIILTVFLLISVTACSPKYSSKQIWQNSNAQFTDHMTSLSEALEAAVSNEETDFRWLMSEEPMIIKKATIDDPEHIKEVKKLIKVIKLSEEAVDFTDAALEYPVIILNAYNGEQEIFSWAFYGESPLLYYNDGQLADGTVAKGYEITNYEEVKSKIDSLLQKAEFVPLGS